MSKNERIGRVRYEKDWCGEGEHYIFESKWEDETEWDFECAAPLCSFGEYKDMIHYTALTKIREWAKCGITRIYWK